MPTQVDLPPLWISYWAALSSIIVLWDVGYCFYRPRSFGTGDLAWIWAPYNMLPYSEVDLLYGQKALDDNNGFTNAQALINIIEVILNIEYLYLRHTSSRSTRRGLVPGTKVQRYHGHAPLVGFSSALMTLAKTVLYFLQDYFGGWSMIGHNTTKNLIIWTATNGTWIVVPFVVCVVQGQFIAKILNRQHASDSAYVEWAQAHPTASSSGVVKQLEGEVPELASFVQVQDGNNSEDGVEVTVEVKPAGARTSPVSSAKPTSLVTKTNGSLPSISHHNPSNSSSSAQTHQSSIASSSNPSFPIVYPGSAIPLTFHLESRTVLVIGNRRLASTRSFAFLEADAKVVIASADPLSSAHDEIQYRQRNNQLQYIQITSRNKHDWSELFRQQQVSMVCVTDTMIGSSSRPVESAQVIHDAAVSLNIPINVSDHPSLSTYTFPSVHRFQGLDGPSHLQVAVSTNGQGCRLSGRIKREIVAKLPSVIGAAVDNVGRLRQRARSKSTSRISEDDVDTPLNNPVPQLDTPSLLRQASYQLLQPVAADPQQLRRMRWVHQMSEYYSLEALARLTEDDLNRALDTWKDDSLPHHDGLVTGAGGQGAKLSRTTQGRISLIGSGPGHPSLLTVAALHSLRNATLILSDKLVPSEILALIPKTTKLHIAKKFPGNNEGAQNEMMVMALEGARAGEDVVRLKQGDPFVYGRGGEEVLYFRENGFESTLIPGVSSAMAGPLMMGIPVTQRGVAESMIMCTGVGRAGKSVQLPGYIKSRTTCILMGVARISNIVDVLTNPSAPGRDGPAYPLHLPIAIIERASSPDQRVILSTLENIAEALKSVEERPPGMMLVGWAALCLEGAGRVDILDTEDQGGELGIVSAWLGEGRRWKIREGLSGEWDEFMATVHEIHGGKSGVIVAEGEAAGTTSRLEEERKMMASQGDRSVSRGRERAKA